MLHSNYFGAFTVADNWGVYAAFITTGGIGNVPQKLITGRFLDVRSLSAANNLFGMQTPMCSQQRSRSL